MVCFLIRRCQKEGVKITISTEPEALADFNTLLDITASRQHFHRFSKKYVQDEFSSFAPHGEAVVVRAYLNDGTLDTAAVFMFYKTMSCYRHAASRLTDKIASNNNAEGGAALQGANGAGSNLPNVNVDGLNNPPNPATPAAVKKNPNANIPALSPTPSAKTNQ
jgi:hypothetical protein